MSYLVPMIGPASWEVLNLIRQIIGGVPRRSMSIMPNKIDIYIIT
jgi:hypothetical protein